MTYEVNAEDLELLTKGSVWTKHDGTNPVYVMFITNTTLGPKALARFPSQVVYHDEDGNIFNRSIGDFLNLRKFHNVDPELEARLENLIQFNTQDVPELDLSGSDDEVQQQIASMTREAEEAQAHEDDLENTSLRVGYYPTETEGYGDPLLSVEELVRATVGYSVEPMIEQNQSMHRFDFRLGGSITIETIEAVFNPVKSEEAHRNFYAAFGIGAMGQARTIEWDTYLGVFPSYTTKGLYCTLMLATDGLYESEQPTVEQHTHEDQQAEVDTLPSETEPMQQIEVQTTVSATPVTLDVTAAQAQTIMSGTSLNTTTIAVSPADNAQTQEHAAIQQAQMIAVQPVDIVAVTNVSHAQVTAPQQAQQ